MTTLYDIVDSNRYVHEMGQQAVITRALDENFTVKRVEATYLRPGMIPAGSTVLSRLKLRTLDKVLDSVSSCIPEACKVFVSEFDPWCNFQTKLDGGDVNPYGDAYERITLSLQRATIDPDPLDVWADRPTFLLPSNFWAAKCRERLIKAVFCRPWLHPDQCRDPIPWADRKYDVAFFGTIHPSRAAFFEGLERAGIKVHVEQMMGYQQYLDALRDTRITVRTEPVRGEYDFPITGVNALYFRDVEAASQGCFSVRTFDTEGVHWVGCNHRSFKDVEGAARQIRSILHDEPNRDEMSLIHVNNCKLHSTWDSVAKVIKDSVKQ